KDWVRCYHPHRGSQVEKREKMASPAAAHGRSASFRRKVTCSKGISVTPSPRPGAPAAGRVQPHDPPQPARLRLQECHADGARYVTAAATAAPAVTSCQSTAGPPGVKRTDGSPGTPPGRPGRPAPSCTRR